MIDDALKRRMDAAPLLEKLLQDPSSRGRKAIEALVALVLFSPFANQQSLRFQPPEQRVQRTFVNHQTIVGERFTERVAVLLGFELGEYRDNQAAPPELEPQGIENPRIWRKSGCRREWIHRVHHTVCLTHCMQYSIRCQGKFMYSLEPTIYDGDNSPSFANL